jgi:hypothetical protein
VELDRFIIGMTSSTGIIIAGGRIRSRFPHAETLQQRQQAAAAAAADVMRAFAFAVMLLVDCSVKVTKVR